ncbi:hypothetical protein ACHRVK_19105 [Flavobacterium plurextorum]
MLSINRFKILIVGLTTVLALQNYGQSDFRKEIEKNWNKETKEIK